MVSLLNGWILGSNRTVIQFKQETGFGMNKLLTNTSNLLKNARFKLKGNKKFK